MSVTPAPRLHDDGAELLLGVVVHWRNEEDLAALVESWPRDRRFALAVVDNSASAPPPADRRELHWIVPSSNLGFGGGVEAGAATSKAPWILLLNPDVRVDPEALERLHGIAQRWADEDPRLGFVAPRLLDHRGQAGQFRWQLRPLPRRTDLLAQCLFLSRPRGARVEPAEGAAVEQPAAAALLLRRDALEDVGGFDPRYRPAWFEDVDLAWRLREAGWTGRYARSAAFVHRGGASVPSLGFGRFLAIYYRNLERFARARRWQVTAALIRPLLVLTALARVPTVALRRPRAAASRRDAARAFLALARHAALGWDREEGATSPAGAESRR